MAKTEKMRCSACNGTFDIKEFFSSYSFRDKGTGKMSICKNCCSDLYDRLKVEQQDEYKALYRFCMVLDLIFIKDMAMKILEKNTKNSNKNLGYLYMNRLALVQYRSKTFKDSTDFINVFGLSEDDFQNLIFTSVENTKDKILKESKKVITGDVIARWGKNYEIEDYIFLEERFQSMLNSYDDKNPASIWDYQEMCISYLALRKERGNYSAQKTLMETINKLQLGCKMKISQIDNSEDDNACFGRFIDRIENYEPCDKPLPFFADVDGIKKYWKKWFVQPFARALELTEDKETEKELMDGVVVEDYTNDLNTMFSQEKDGEEE